MLKTAEDLAGPYVWGQYDLLVLPPSFPYGGMENPCLTFVTPTLLVSVTLIKVSFSSGLVYPSSDGCQPRNWIRKNCTRSCPSWSWDHTQNFIKWCALRFT